MKMGIKTVAANLKKALEANGFSVTSVDVDYSNGHDLWVCVSGERIGRYEKTDGEWWYEHHSINYIAIRPVFRVFAEKHITEWFMAADERQPNAYTWYWCPEPERAYISNNGELTSGYISNDGELTSELRIFSISAPYSCEADDCTNTAGFTKNQHFVLFNIWLENSIIADSLDELRDKLQQRIANEFNVIRAQLAQIDKRELSIINSLSSIPVENMNEN
jgi:hypothetical protein